MNTLKADAFVTTQRHVCESMGENTDPRKAYMRQAAVELFPDGSLWLAERFERACIKYGKLAPAVLAQLDWPTAVPSP